MGNLLDPNFYKPATTVPVIVRDDSGAMPTATVYRTESFRPVAADPTIDPVTPTQPVVTGYQNSNGQYTGAVSQVVAPNAISLDQPSNASPDPVINQPKINPIIIIFVLVIIAALFFFSSKK